MLTITEKASETIKDTLKNHKNPLAIRILKQGGG
jgi:Fe-S cluster assembly iron-binding protein IscA